MSFLPLSHDGRKTKQKITTSYHLPTVTSRMSRDWKSALFIIMSISFQFVLTRSFQYSARVTRSNPASVQFHTTTLSMSSSSTTTMTSRGSNNEKGKILVLGGTGFLGQTICRRANAEGYTVTSISRRGFVPEKSNSMASLPTSTTIDYRIGDARQKESISNILEEGGYVAIIHCIGLLFDDSTGLGNYNRFVSGSGSIPDADATYDTITRLTAFNAVDVATDYVSKKGDTTKRLPFIFISAAEAGWPNVGGGKQVENYLAPDWLKRYLAAKRAVEEKLSSSSSILRPVIFRPSLIFSLDRPGSYPAVGAFFVFNRIGLPFVDRPVTVQSLANAVVRSISREEVVGVQRYKDVDALNE